VNNVKILPSTRAIIIFAGDGGKVEHIEVENLTAETCIHTGDWWGKGEGFVLCAKNSNGAISDITFKNCSFVQENPSIIAGEAGNISNVTLSNCEHTYRRGNAHPYYVGKIDLQPNVPGLATAPFQAEDKIYITEDGCRNLQIK
jgi:hypothetical protein